MRIRSILTVVFVLLVSMVVTCNVSDRHPADVGGEVSPNSLCFCCDPDGAFPQSVGSITIEDIGSPDPEAGELEFATLTGDSLSASPESGTVPEEGSSTVEISANSCEGGTVTFELGREGLPSDSSVAHVQVEAKVCEGDQVCNEETCECEEQETCSPTNSIYATAFALSELLGVDFNTCLIVTIAQIIHSAISVGAKDVAHDHTTIKALRALSIMYTMAMLNQLFLQSDFDCGEGPNGYTICPNIPAGNMTEGDYYVLFNIVEEDLPLDDAGNIYQYGFVFDQDGNTSNNYQPSDQYANDFFKDTDRWYEANYNSTDGWTLKVTDATDGVFTEIASDARIIIVDNVMVLVVPAAELATEDPDYRLTAFRHTGDYGITSGDWDGSVWPAVADGLQSFPTP